MTKIIIADDHQVLLDGLEYMLEGLEDVEIVARCTNGKQVLHRLAEKETDLLILDINMPRMNGIEVAEQIQKNYPGIKIIALSMHDQPSFVNRMLNLGACGYVLKDEGKETIRIAVKTVLAGEIFLSDSIREVMNQHRIKGVRDPGLTEREKEVLEALAEGMTSHEIAEKLFISFHTVKTHRKHLLRKFDVKNVTSLLNVAKELGMI